MNAPLPNQEKLRVHQGSIAFLASWAARLEEVPARLGARNRRGCASASIALNIAEGHGKRPSRGRANRYDIARASALECAACRDALVDRQVLTGDEIRPGKELLAAIVSRLSGRNQAVSTRIGDREGREYGAGLSRVSGIRSGVDLKGRRKKAGRLLSQRASGLN